MTREEQLQFCRICQNNVMDLKRGLKCKLTDDFADFKNHCANFVEDEAEKTRKHYLDVSTAGDIDGNPLNANRNKEIGIVAFIIGVVLLIATIANFNNLGFVIIPWGAIIYGALMYQKGLQQEKTIRKQEELEDKIKSKSNKD